MLYVTHKSTVETAIGIVGQVMHFRQFSVHGLEQVIGVWGLVCLAFNIKRLAALSG